jgi:hypothetical protein
MSTQSLRALIERRNGIRQRIALLERELEAVERQIFSRVDRVAAMLDGELSAAGTLRVDQPTLQGMGISAAIGSVTLGSQSHSIPMVPPVQIPNVSTPPSLTPPGERGLVFHSVVSGDKVRVNSRTGTRIASAVEAILKREGRPMRTAELLDRLYIEGVVVPGSRPRNNLAAHLSNAPTLESTPHGWKLRELARAEEAPADPA